MWSIVKQPSGLTFQYAPHCLMKPHLISSDQWDEFDLLNSNRTQTKCAFSTKLPEHKLDSFGDTQRNQTQACGDAEIHFSIPLHSSNSDLISSDFSYSWFRTVNTWWQHTLTLTFCYTHRHTHGHRNTQDWEIGLKLQRSWRTLKFIWLWFT